MANRYSECITCEHNKGKWSFPNGVYPCGQTACTKPDDDISTSAHIAIDLQNNEHYQKMLNWAELQDWRLIDKIVNIVNYGGGREYTININGVEFAINDFSNFEADFIKLIAKYRIWRRE